MGEALVSVIIQIAKFVIISVVIQIGIATVLIIFGKGRKSVFEEGGLAFHELFFDYSNIPSLKAFDARDGKQLKYRQYPAQSNTVLILIHGSGWHSQYFLSLADFISSKGIAQVYTPDLRGHGSAPERRGDLDYINQFEDDLSDFLTFIREENPHATLVLGGHSSGGGLVIRFAGSRYSQQADGYLLLSPFLKYDAPTIRPNSGGWAHAYTGRIAGLSMLNMLGIHRFDYLPAIEFNMPKEARDGTETLLYSHRLNTAFAPRNYKKDLSSITQPVLLVAGTADDAFIAEQFEPVMSKYADIQFKLLPGVTHMGVVVSRDVQPVLKDWLEDFNEE